MNRRESRELVFSLLFEAEFNKEKPVDEIYENAMISRGFVDNNYIKAAFRGATEKLDEIDELITASSNKWKISRMSAVTRAILRLAVYEMKFGNVPPKVVINEAVEISKKYDEDSAPAFINGILNNIAKTSGIIPCEGGAEGE